MSQSLVFQNTTFSVVDRNGQPWLRASEIAQALGYSRSDKVGQLYERNADEFTDQMTAVIETLTLGVSETKTCGVNLTTKTRIFSIRGAHLLAMFARTAIAKEFRIWLLDLADREIGNTITPAMQSDLHAIVDTISPDGKKHGMVWKRLNRYMRVARYQQIPLGRFEEAKQYLINTFLGGQYIAAPEEPIYNIAEAMTSKGTPTVAVSPDLQRSVNNKAFAIAHEVFEIAQRHIQNKVAYHCEEGWPRRLNEAKAMRMIEALTLDMVLSGKYHELMENAESMAETLTAMTSRYSAEVKAMLRPATSH